jgi:5-methylthioribose kinase
LNYVSWEGRTDKTEVDINRYRIYLLDSMEDIWREFLDEFNYLWENESRDIITKTAGYREYYIKNLLHETIGFCACEIMRRIIGMAHVPDMDAVEDPKKRAGAQIMGLKVGQAILINRNNIDSVGEFVKLVKDSAK